MKVILTMAVSANGIIATKTGSEDFLYHDNWLQFVKLDKKVGCFMQGRKTNEAKHLKDEGFQEAIITGGSTINSEFAKRGLIDEVILDVNPSM